MNRTPSPSAPIIDLDQHRIARRYRGMVADPLPFGQPKDYPTGPRYVRPIDPAVIARIMDTDHAEQQRIARIIEETDRDIRIMRLQAFIHWACIGIALGTVAYFVAEFAR